MTPADLAYAGGTAPGYITGDGAGRGTTPGSELRFVDGSCIGSGCVPGSKRHTGGAGDPDSYKYAPHSRGYAAGAMPGHADEDSDYYPFE